MKKTILLCVACLLLAGFAAAQQAATRPANGDSVPIEEYVPKVIIEGKWGTGPGEFGRQGDVGYDLKPESLAVDSKGNIYVLDFVNNRIQKYSDAGKHLMDILIDGLRGPVECWAVKRYDEGLKKEIWSVGATSEKPANVAEENLQAYIWPPEIQGINIVIDSKDTLYYYLKRTKDGKETGEVWEFRKDKLVKKILGDSYVIPTDMPRQHANVGTRNEREINLTFAGGKRLKLIAGKGGKYFNDGEARKRRISNKVWLEKDGLLGVVSEHDGQLWTNYYNKDGVLVKKFRWSSKPNITGYFDKNRNMYLPEITRTGLRIVKYELREVK